MLIAFLISLACSAVIRGCNIDNPSQCGDDFAGQVVEGLVGIVTIILGLIYIITLI